MILLQIEHAHLLHFQAQKKEKNAPPCGPTHAPSLDILFQGQYRPLGVTSAVNCPTYRYYRRTGVQRVWLSTGGVSHGRRGAKVILFERIIPGKYFPGGTSVMYRGNVPRYNVTVIGN